MRLLTARPEPAHRTGASRRDRPAGSPVRAAAPWWAGRRWWPNRRIGQPVAWGPCQQAGGGGDSLPIPAGAQCGKIAVPVSYDNPDGAQATLALIRFPPPGSRRSDRCSSIPAVPASPESRPRPASSRAFPSRCVSASTWWASTRAASAPPPRRCGATPTTTTIACGPTRRSTTAPAGVEHIEKTTKEFVAALRRQDGQRLPRERRNRQCRQGSRCAAGRGRRRQAELPGLLLRHPDRRRLRRGLSRQGPRDDPRRRRRPERRSRSRPTSTRPRPSRRPSTTTPPTAPRTPTARWAPTRPSPSPCTAAWSIRWWTSR